MPSWKKPQGSSGSTSSVRSLQEAFYTILGFFESVCIGFVFIYALSVVTVLPLNTKVLIFDPLSVLFMA